jgi:hypothetical protein
MSRNPRLRQHRRDRTAEKFEPCAGRDAGAELISGQMQERRAQHALKPRLVIRSVGPRQAKLARQMYEETGDDGKRKYTVQQIAKEFGGHCCILAIGPLELVSSARPEAPRQGSNARFVMVLHGDCGACFAALSCGEGALWLNATVRIGVYRPQVVV